MARFQAAFVLALLVVVTGCPAPGVVVAASDSGSRELSDDAGLVRAELDAGSDGGLLPSVLPLVVFAMAAADGGGELATTVLDHASEPSPFIEVEPTQGFMLSTGMVFLRDYRIRIIDGADQVVPSDDRAIENEGGFTYFIRLVAPLKPGRTYILSIEAQTGVYLTDQTGKSWDDVRLVLKVRGKPEPEPGKPPKRKKKR